MWPGGGKKVLARTSTLSVLIIVERFVPLWANFRAGILTLEKSEGGLIMYLLVMYKPVFPMCFFGLLNSVTILVAHLFVKGVDRGVR